MSARSLNSISLTGVTPSLAKAIGIEPPMQSEASIEALDRLVAKNAEGGKVDRIFMYNPDAVALWLYQKYTEYYLPLQEQIKLTLPLRSVMPSVTPVCFGTMYTGAMPAVHGIQAYEKPVIKIDTLFDALIRAGKKPAIVSTEGDSLSMIFLERPMDYFIYPTVDECTEKALQLIEEDKYDFIACYNGNYDTIMHYHGPESKEALGELRMNSHAFGAIYEQIRTQWTNHRTLLGFAMDHGSHDIDEIRKGKHYLGHHATDMPEDLNICHHYAALGATKEEEA